MIRRKKEGLCCFFGLCDQLTCRRTFLHFASFLDTADILNCSHLPAILNPSHMYHASFVEIANSQLLPPSNTLHLSHYTARIPPQPSTPRRSISVTFFGLPTHSLSDTLHRSHVYLANVFGIANLQPSQHSTPLARISPYLFLYCQSRSLRLT